MEDETEKPGEACCPLEVDERLKEQATRCRNEKHCLQGRGLCKVVDNVAEKVFFIEREPERSCCYCLSFGEAFYCNCPVRQELYRKYRR